MRVEKDEGVPFSELSPQDQARWQEALENPSTQSWVTEDGEEIPVQKGG